MNDIHILDIKLITTDIASSDSSDSSNGDDDDDGSVQIGLMAGEEGLLPEKCVKLTSSGVGMEVMYAGDADYSNYIGQEIELMIIMKNSCTQSVLCENTVHVLVYFFSISDFSM